MTQMRCHFGRKFLVKRAGHDTNAELRPQSTTASQTATCTQPPNRPCSLVKPYTPTQNHQQRRT
uniref:Uncharacterized protein n=1 Tax=Arundo donax TaxID=35708 RepID=A0A0A9DAW2_ARUDO